MESDVTTRPQTTDSETQLGASGAFLSREVGIEQGGAFEMRPSSKSVISAISARDRGRR